MPNSPLPLHLRMSCPFALTPEIRCQHQIHVGRRQHKTVPIALKGKPYATITSTRVLWDYISKVNGASLPLIKATNNHSLKIFCHDDQDQSDMEVYHASGACRNIQTSYAAARGGDKYLG